MTSADISGYVQVWSRFRILLYTCFQRKLSSAGCY